MSQLYARGSFTLQTILMNIEFEKVRDLIHMANIKSVPQMNIWEKLNDGSGQSKKDAMAFLEHFILTSPTAINNRISAVCNNVAQCFTK